MQKVVATIGVFDGVHRGHRLLLDAVCRGARAEGAIAAVVGFDPHPVEVLAPASPPQRLTPRRVQARLFAELGVERAWFLPFSRGWAGRSPGEFVDELRARFELIELWVGHDFRFGRSRAGDFDFLVAEGARWGFRVQRLDALKIGERVVSSTWAREALRAGDLATVGRLLGHHFAIDATVVRGRGVGAKLLVPTANLRFAPRQCLPAGGVYACWAEAAGGLWPAVANVGTRPTLTPDTHVTVEVHLIDVDLVLVGAPLSVVWGVRLREERRFDGVGDLRKAVHEDIARARIWLEGRTPADAPTEGEGTDATSGQGKG